MTPIPLFNFLAVSLVTSAVLLIVTGVLLLVLELFLPTHGIIGALGALLLLGAVGVSYRINPWAGVALLAALVASTPLAWIAMVRIWPRTSVGRRMILPLVKSDAEQLPFQIGQRGVAISSLRPMGECEVGGKRIAACAADGIIDAGAEVIVVSADGRRAMVRPVEQKKERIVQ